MPRYFFDLSDGTCERDIEGTVLKDLDEASVEAVKHAAELTKDDPHRVWSDGKLQVEVTDDNRDLLLVVTISARKVTTAKLSTDRPTSVLEPRK